MMVGMRPGTVAEAERLLAEYQGRWGRLVGRILARTLWNFFIGCSLLAAYFALQF